MNRGFFSLNGQSLQANFDREILTHILTNSEMLAEHTYCFIAHIKNLEKTCQQHMGMLRDFKLDMEVASLQILLNNVLGNVGSINCSHTVCFSTQFAPPFFSIFKTYNVGFKFLLLPTSKPSESCDCPQIA